MGFSNNSMTNLVNRTGNVDIAGCLAWLRDNGCCFAGEACDRVAASG
jgi:hypothetical protein